MSIVTGEFLAILIMACAMRLKTRESSVMDALMMLPASFRIEGERGMQASCCSMEEVMECSRAVEAFCTGQGASGRISAVLSLAVEEIAGNTVRYGFADGRKHSIDIRVKKNERNWVLLFHDDCSGFDPTKYLQEPDAPFEHNGIRMIRKLVTEVTYINALGLNHLLISVSQDPVRSDETDC